MQALRNEELTGDGRCVRQGFASLFLAALNETWPHSGHILVNAGRGGVTLAYWAGECISSLLPTRVDLLLLETYSTATEAEVELDILPIIAAVAARSPHVAVAILSASRVAPPRSGNAQDVGAVPHNPDVCADVGGGYGQRCSWRVDAPGRLIRSADYECSASMVARLPAAVRATAPQDEVLAAAAAAHGWTVISLRRGLAAGLEAGAPARLGWSECEWGASLR